jgi:chromosome segregation protein
LPVSFSRLRIAGFKSFAEPAVIEIRPGLTGIVGPNGCGKSNVVEALRWAMGESSARSLRGGEMDDVIFAGTAARPSRNLAEVCLQLDSTSTPESSVFPAPFHESPELEVSRRIERGGGSVYRVNGREARARDVQTLFADLATGAHSSGMVSQGRVGAIVNAKPDERRSILEEAAGITGLHARRHEADLKLRAAEANLSRAEDLRGQLEVQLDGLRRQARQAHRYRTISGAIRTAEAELLAIQRARVEAIRSAARAALHEAGIAVAEATVSATAAAARAAAAAAALPALRGAEGEARTALERHRLAGEQIAAEAARAEAALAAAGERLDQIGSDLAHAEQSQRDAAAADARLSQEDARIAAEDEAHPPHLHRAEAEAAATADAMRAAEAEANRATEHAADLSARHRALTEAVAQADHRARRLAEQIEKLRRDHAEVAAQRVDPARLEDADAARDAADSALTCARAALEAAEQARATALAEAQRRRAAAQESGQHSRAAARQQAEHARAAAHRALAAARERAAAADAVHTRLAAESQALAELLAVKDNELWPRMVDQLTVPAGLEAALGAALGEELESASDTAAARHWRTLPPLDPPPLLPQGAIALTGLVQAPPALARALSQIGLIDQELAEQGGDAQLLLAPGQMLVSRAGAVWRWDGYTVGAGTQTAATVRLQQRNRLAGLRAQLAEAEHEATASRKAHATAEADEHRIRAQTEADERAARDAADALERAARTEAESAEQHANAAERAARATRGEAEHRLERARAEAAHLAAQAATALGRLAGLDEQAARLDSEQAEAATTLSLAQSARAVLADPQAARAAMEQARAALSDARAREAAARAERDALARAAAGRAHRRRGIAAERADWGQRADDAAGRVTDLAARRAAAQAEHAALVAAPGEIAARGARALDELEAAEATHRSRADALAVAETEATAADRTARAAESALSLAREHTARIEGEVTQADQAWGVVAERILERLGADAALPDPPAELGPETEEKARRKLERLQREREEMGPVNLRADVEAEEIGKQIDTIRREGEELTTAIAKLRGSIGNLNREGRERLSQVFEQVDRHFQSLFARMFGGGRAHLAMVGSDDPLLAGLEIYAQPPGKKLATLSLLSGGEQALTALSLIFAVFRCNPAPVCVLDEVDAPLDDVNVERFCTLLNDMVAETSTRFLVVTHHHLTMARMDRLYGVTMQERGVSRLLSVDLQSAAELVDQPRMAAE